TATRTGSRRPSPGCARRRVRAPPARARCDGRPAHLPDAAGTAMSTLLAVFAHPDDEVAAAGTLMAQRARGDRVVVVFLTAGEMTEAFGPIAPEEVAARRTAQGAEAARILGVEHRFLAFQDTHVEATRAAALEVAGVICEVKPDAL